MTVLLPPPSLEVLKLSVRFTRADCERTEELGFLDYRYELMEGIIVPIMGQLMPHMLTVSRANAWLLGYFGYDRVLEQGSITVAPGETAIVRPEPDIIVLNKSGADVLTDEPSPADILLLVEVSDTTLDYDLTTKAGVYERAGIAQYLVIDIVGRVVYDHRLTVEGAYRRETRRPGDPVILAATPDVALSVDDLLLPQ